jgi:hypothetical protein
MGKPRDRSKRRIETEDGRWKMGDGKAEAGVTPFAY